MAIDRISLEGLASIAQAIAAAALAPGTWEDVLYEMRRQVGEVRVHMFGFDLDNADTAIASLAGYDPKIIELYEEHYSTTNAWAPGFSRFSAGQIMPSQLMCEDDDLCRTEFYHEWVVPQEDAALGGGAMLIKDPGRTFMIGGNVRRKDGLGLQDRWLDTLALVTPLLQQSLRVNRALAGRDLESHLYEDDLAPARAALVVLAPGGHVVHANRRAADLLDKGEVLGVDGAGRLRILARREAASPAGAAPAPDRAEILVSPDGSRYLCDRITLADGWLDGHPVWRMQFGAAPLTVVVLKPVPAIGALERRARSFGLTRAEIEVVQALGRGLSLNEIAEQRGRRLVTIRNQIASAMQKTGARRQVELILMLSSDATERWPQG